MKVKFYVDTWLGQTLYFVGQWPPSGEHTGIRYSFELDFPEEPSTPLENPILEVEDDKT